MDDLDEVYVVHLQEDCHPFGYRMRVCRDWGSALWNANMLMGDVCSEEWEEHEILPEAARTGIKARWTWGYNEVRIAVETVL